MRVSLAVAALVLLVVTGCGGVQNEPNLAAAVERTEATGTMRFEIRGEEAFGGEPTQIQCTGAVDRPRGRLAIKCAWGSGDAYDFIAIGNVAYVRGVGEGLADPRIGDRWVRSSEDAGPASDASLDELSPERLLAMLRAASRETERIGEEDVRGTSTVRYRLTVDCDDANLACDGTTPVEVWIDEDGLVRRIAFDDETGTGTIEFFDFGAEIEIEPPPADEVVEEESLDDGGITSVPDQLCADTASPITVERAISTLRRHGFEVDHEDALCAPDIAAALSTPLAEHDPFLFCDLLSEAAAVDVQDLDVFSTGGFEREWVDRELANLRCALYVERKTDPAVERLDAALADLKAAIGP